MKNVKRFFRLIGQVVLCMCVAVVATGLLVATVEGVVKALYWMGFYC